MANIVCRGPLLSPCDVVRERSKYRKHTNSHKFMLTDDVWNDGRVKDVTEKLRTAPQEAEA